MPTVSKIRLISNKSDVKVLLTIENLEQAIPVYLDIGTHNTIASHWSASITCLYSSEINAWEGRFDRNKERQGVVEIMSIVADNKNLVNNSDVLFVPGVRTWKGGQIAKNAFIQLRADKRQRFDMSLQQTNYDGDNTFAAILIVNNLNISKNQQVPGLLAMPRSESLTHRALANDFASAIQHIQELAPDIKIKGIIDQEKWAHLSRANAPSSLVYAHSIIAADKDNAISVAIQATSRLNSLFTINRDDAPIIAGGLLFKVKGSELTLVNYWSEISPWMGNIVGGMISGENPYQLVEQWEKLNKNPRSQLLISIYRDAIAEKRWDHQIFRLFTLLELVGRDTFGNRKKVVNSLGQRINKNAKPIRYYTTTDAFGKVYKLLQSGLFAGKDELIKSQHNQIARSLEAEVKLWSQIRNVVAHYGVWDPNRLWKKYNQKIEQIGHDEIQRSIREAAKFVVLQELSGHIKIGRGIVLK